MDEPQRSLTDLRDQMRALLVAYTETERAASAPPSTHRIPYASRVFGAEERIALLDATLDFWLTSGRFCAQFEGALADYLGVRTALAVNSGSSANLLAFMALTSPLLGDRALRRGDEVICVAAAFPTTVSPIVQFGAIPVFVDVTLPSANIDASQLEAALSSRTRAVFVAHALGFPFDLRAVSAFCRRHGLFLIEDNCDALGARYDMGGGERMTGAIGDIGTSSFYPAHHMTMGEGGAVYTSDPLLARILQSMRDWGRDCVCASGQDGACGHRFDGRHGSLPEGYDHKYVYAHLGYNLKITDMQAAIGVEQLRRLPGFVEARRAHWSQLRAGLADLSDRLHLPEEPEHARASPFGFLMTLRAGSGLERARVAREIEGRGVQTRALFSGNLLRHPCCAHWTEGVDYRAIGDLPVTDRIMEGALWVGVYPGLTGAQLEAMVAAIREAVGA